MTITDLRKHALDAFQVGVAAADPQDSLARALKNDALLPLAGGRYIIIAVGKAATKMAKTAIQCLPAGVDFTAFAVTNYENHQKIAGCKVIAAGHPVPDQNGFDAANQIIACLKSATEKDCVLACISGGSSALLPAPVPGLTLNDKIHMNQILLASGMDITQMNLVRQSLSMLKGGGLLRIAFPAPVRSYILSDVIGDDLRVVGSGPTTQPIGTAQDALKLLKEQGILADMPAAIQTYLATAVQPEAMVEHHSPTLIGSNSQSAKQMALAAGAQLENQPLVGLVEDAAAHIVRRIANARTDGPVAIAFGGETTVNVTGTGKGGRNQELALRIVLLLDQMNYPNCWCFLSGGTDGRDGPTDAAGGLVDNFTIQRISEKGGRVSAFLDNNDSYAALLSADDLLMTGATGTNVADLHLFLSEES